MSAAQGPDGAVEPGRRPGTARMLAWTAPGGRRLEAVRAVLGERGIRATGRIVVAEDGAEPYTASYTVGTDETGVVTRLSVRATTSAGERHVLLNRDEDGIWLLDPPGPGRARAPFDGARDAAVAGSPLFTGLPVRRLGLHRAPGEHDLPVVQVQLPSLEVAVVRATYRGGPDGVSAGPSDLVLDDDGLVVEQPGVGSRA